tara:strand:- start:533 stop:2086 length:1554 start_codon:yes stop_codon:yes gene_type:complete
MEILKKKIQILLNFFKAKKFNEAEVLNRDLISKYPQAIYLYNILGLVLIEQKKVDESIKCYKDGIKIKSDYAPFYDNIATAYKIKGDYVRAEENYKISIRLNDKAVEPVNNLGNLYIQINKIKLAIECYKKAINLKGSFFLSHYNLALAYKTIGEFEKAKKHFWKSIDLNERFYSAHRSISEIIKYKKKDKHLKILKKINNYSKNEFNNKKELFFALGKAHDDIKEYDEAFKFYSKGNEIRNDESNFSLNTEKKLFNNIKEIFNNELFERFKNSGTDNSTPIFILGMPRSGTTLLEQIISSHQNVFPGDEVNFIPNLISKYTDNDTILKSLYKINNFDFDVFKSIGNDYVRKLKMLSNDSIKVTDKLPINFKWIGFIKLILPKAKIIHSVRNSKDTCISIFKNYFVNPNLNFAYSLKNIVSYYNLYDNLMKHWKETLPNFIVDINYEKIISNPDKEIKDLINKTDLSWDINCLKYYNNKRAIKTASDTQARKKIYTTSLNSWKNYKRYLKKDFINLR